MSPPQTSSPSGYSWGLRRCLINADYERLRQVHDHDPGPKLNGSGETGLPAALKNAAPRTRDCSFAVCSDLFQRLARPTTPFKAKNHLSSSPIEGILGKVGIQLVEWRV